jgi:hypothetical protein
MIPKPKSARPGSVFQCAPAHIETTPTICTTVKIVHARRLIFRFEPEYLSLGFTRSRFAAQSRPGTQRIGVLLDGPGHDDGATC